MRCVPQRRGCCMAYGRGVVEIANTALGSASCCIHSYQPSRFLLDYPAKSLSIPPSRFYAPLSSIIPAFASCPHTTAQRVPRASDNGCYGVRGLIQCVPDPHAFSKNHQHYTFTIYDRVDFLYDKIIQP